MSEKEILDAFEHANRNQMKVNLQMVDTPEEKFILFHPYAMLLDAFDGRSIIGLVEKHHTSPDINYLRRPKLTCVKRINILNDHFEPDHEKWKNLDLATIDVELKA